MGVSTTVVADKGGQGTRAHTAVGGGEVLGTEQGRGQCWPQTGSPLRLQPQTPTLTLWGVLKHNIAHTNLLVLTALRLRLPYPCRLKL
jgi:hypothetical protein